MQALPLFFTNPSLPSLASPRALSTAISQSNRADAETMGAPQSIPRGVVWSVTVDSWSIQRAMQRQLRLSHNLDGSQKKLGSEPGWDILVDGSTCLEPSTAVDTNHGQELGLSAPVQRFHAFPFRRISTVASSAVDKRWGYEG